jgi:magnesium transporter
MIEIFKNTECGLEKLEEVTQGCWIRVVDPTTDEIEYLISIGIPADYIQYSLDVDELSRTEKEDNGIQLILLRIPLFRGPKEDIPYASVPLGIIHTDQAIVTISRKENKILEEFTSGRVKGLSTKKRNRFTLRILYSTANQYLFYLREINRIVDSLEDRLTLSMKNKEVLELLKYQKSLVYFTTALKSNELMMERLQRGQFFKMYPDDEDLLEDVITENRQAITMTNISNDILSSMMDAFASIISNNLNVVMKFLASITIVMSIPTIVTSFFGMNVALPFEEHPYAFLIVIGIFMAFSVIVVVIFQKRDWF